MVPKAEAIDRISKHLAALNVQLDAAKAEMKTAVKPGRYALNFQINALKKEIHYWKNQAGRLRSLPRTEVPLLEKLGT
jgi:capsule polysaccharide export protein KpsE/RkpR